MSTSGMHRRTFEGRHLVSYLGLSRNLFRNLLELHHIFFFIFIDVLYKQTDGLGMSLPLSGCLSNMFLCFDESIWLSNYFLLISKLSSTNVI